MLGCSKKSERSYNLQKNADLLLRMVSHLKQFPEVFCVNAHERCVDVHAGLTTSQERSDAVAGVTRWGACKADVMREGVLEVLKEKSIVTGWRNELYPVASKFNEEPFFLVCRQLRKGFEFKCEG